ncbi:MAG TPA: Holliday junction branch migration protein RuvA [Acidimicrobiales bacterium]|nr:Holliday junction branch migration protein RuvA [Acidimicrobiales bacterium]
MIGSLRGRLEESQHLGGGSSEVLVDVGGVGYRVVVASATASSLPAVGAAVALRVHTHVRESAITLYGFSSAEELRCFEMLLGAHGVGPALALSLLGVLGPAELGRAVVAGDIDALSRVPGVGRKTAARLVVDLGPRFDRLLPTLPSGVVAPPAGERELVAEALAALGYGPEEVRGALERIPPEGDVEGLLRAALGVLAPAAAGR